MRRGAAWLAGAGLLVAAWGVIQLTPADDAAEAAFSVPGEIGRAAVARAFTVTVDDVRLGSRAVAAGWAAEGRWVVVDLAAQATKEESGTMLAYATLTVDGDSYRASERPTSMFRSALAVGIPREGSLAFEIPPAAAEGAATIELALDEETRLDSVVTLTVDLGALKSADEVELRETSWAQR